MSAIDISTCLMVTGGWLMPRTQDVSHGAGQIMPSLVGSEMCIRDRSEASAHWPFQTRSFHSGIRFPNGQPAWQYGMPQSMHRQAGRCMACGIPYCHAGCPLGNLIPEWNDLVWKGQWAEASDRLHATNNFPEFTGRICPAPCETSCVLGINQPPVTIKQVEMSIADTAFERDLVAPQLPYFLTGQTVAVVGSGPSGLAAAPQLTRAGHTVAVFERDDRIGGLLRYGVPDFKLEKHLIDRRIAQMEAEGTRFRPGVEIGKDVTFKELRARYDAVLLATGARVPRRLDVPGADLTGIHFAMEYLRQSNQVVAGDVVPDQIVATGKRVVIIGADGHQSLLRGVLVRGDP